MAERDNPGVSASSARLRAENFCAAYGLELPILLAPMAGACPAGLSAAVANAGGMGAMGALLTPPKGIAAWADAFRRESNGAFQLNLWVPDPPPERDAVAEDKIRRFLAGWGPEVSPQAGDAKPPDFEMQCAALLAARPRAVSSIMGIFAQNFVAALKAHGIAWFACATTLSEALCAEDCRGGCDRRARHRGGRASRRLRSGGGGAARHRPFRFAATPRREAVSSGHRGRRHRGWARHRGGPDPWRLGGSDRHGVFCVARKPR